MVQYVNVYLLRGLMLIINPTLVLADPYVHNGR